MQFRCLQQFDRPLAPSRQCRTVHASYSVSIPYACVHTISNNGCGFLTQKWKASSFTHQLVSIVGAVHFHHSSILGKFCNWGSGGIKVSYWRLINLTLPLDRLERVMAILDSPGILFRCYNWNSSLHIPSPVAVLRLIPSPFSVSETAVLPLSGQNGMETLHCFSCYCKCHVSPSNTASSFLLDFVKDCTKYICFLCLYINSNISTAPLPQLKYGHVWRSSVHVHAKVAKIYIP